MDLHWVFSIAVFTAFKIFTGFVDKSNFVVNINLKDFSQYSLYDESHLYEEEWKGQDSEAAAVCNSRVLWTKNPSLDKYEVVYDTRAIRGQKVEGLLNYVKGYIELASNIVFRERRVGDLNFAQVISDEGGCFVNHSGTKENFSMTLSLPESCWSVSVILHEVLHTLGFMHEQQRKDRDEYISFQRMGYDYAEQYKISCDKEDFRPFPYDVFSTMHYCNYPYLAYKMIPKDRSLLEYLDHPRTFMTSCDWYALNEVYPGAWKLRGCRPNYVPPSLVPTLSFMRWNKNAEKICQFMSGPFFDIKQCVLPDGREYPDVVSELKDFIVSSPPNIKVGSQNTYASKNYNCSKIDWPRLQKLCEEIVREIKSENNGTDVNTQENNNLGGSRDASDNFSKVNDKLTINSRIGGDSVAGDGTGKPTGPVVFYLGSDSQKIKNCGSNNLLNQRNNFDLNQGLINTGGNGNMPDMSSTFGRGREMGGPGYGGVARDPLQLGMNRQGVHYLNHPYYKSWIFNKMNDVNGYGIGQVMDRVGQQFRHFSLFPSNFSCNPSMIYSNIGKFFNGIMKRNSSSDDVEKDTLVKGMNSTKNGTLINTRPLKRSPMSKRSNHSGRRRFLQSRPDTESDAIEQPHDASISEDVSDSLKDTIQSNNTSNSLKKKSSYRRGYLTLHRKLIGVAKPKISAKLQRRKKLSSPRLLQPVSDTDARVDDPNKNSTVPINPKVSQTKRNMTIEEEQFLHL